MKVFRSGRLFFRLVSLALTFLHVLLPVDSLMVWTAQPANPTKATKGNDISLRWDFFLNSTELTQSQTYYSIIWKKFNASTLSYSRVGSLSYLQVIGSVQYNEPLAPHIVVDRAEEATLQIKNVIPDDEGRYKIEYSVDLSGTVLNEDEVNLTVEVPSEITGVSHDQVICEGSLVVLSCNATGKPTPTTFNWTKVEDDGTDSAPLLPVVDGKYVLSNIQRSANGTYRCTAYNGVGVPINRTVSVKVEYSPAVERIVISSDSVNEGQSFDMTCVTCGYPEPNVYWIKENNGARINGSVLTFTNINRNDSGQYRCEAKNDCGSNSSVQSIDVFYQPNITYISANMSVNQRESVNLTCRADGNPKPAITWSKDGNTINSSFTVGGKSDEGLYVCNASNGIGNASSKAVFITVKYFGPFNTSFTTLTRNPSIVYLNTSFNLSCSAQASPPARYRFYRGQERLGNISVGNTFNTSVVQRTCQVNYSCIPFNYFGDGKTKMITVEVYYSPQVTERNKTYVVSPGNSATLTCPVDGNPPPLVQWYKGDDNSGLPLHTGKTWKIDEPTSSNSGLYTCWANNSVGNVTATVILQFVTKVAEATEEATRSPTNQPNAPPWPIIGGIIGAVVVVIIVILLVAWWVHNKRKCRRKDTKIHSSESEVLHGQNDIEDGVHARVNGGYDGRYADSGPPSANGTNKFVQPQSQSEQQQQQQAAAAPPAYAVVDKSKKKKKKKKAEAEDPYAEVEDPKKDKKTADSSTHDYAVVNKSKKKKKEEDENAYATVDKSKKSKKGQQKPKAPGEVLYADLGDFQPVQPLPTVSTSPEPLAPIKRRTPYQETEYADITQFLKGNATLPEGQSTEMQPTYANAGGGQEAAANKENANTGGEGDIEPKETPM